MLNNNEGINEVDIMDISTLARRHNEIKKRQIKHKKLC